MRYFACAFDHANDTGVSFDVLADSDEEAIVYAFDEAIRLGRSKVFIESEDGAQIFDGDVTSKTWATDILWDTDGEEIDDLPVNAPLPSTCTIENAADWLSEAFGWCVAGLNYTYLAEAVSVCLPFLPQVATTAKSAF